MRVVRLTLEYDGTAYAGWQVQGNGVAVQSLVEAALEEVLQEKVRLVSSGRTDAGVHARGMVAHLVTASALPLKAFRDGVNRHLPPDIAVIDAADAPSGFHARFDARGKWYRYSLLQGPVRSPLAAKTSWHLRSPLDLSAMGEAAAALVGEHDFGAFRTTGCDARTTVRRLYSVALVGEGRLLHIDVRGSGFLRHMVRILAGTLVEIGLGKRPASDIGRLLAREESVRAGVKAPPQGLCLMEVWY